MPRQEHLHVLGIVYAAEHALPGCPDALRDGPSERLLVRARVWLPDGVLAWYVNTTDRRTCIIAPRSLKSSVCGKITCCTPSGEATNFWIAFESEQSYPAEGTQ